MFKFSEHFANSKFLFFSDKYLDREDEIIKRSGKAQVIGKKRKSIQDKSMHQFIINNVDKNFFY